ncbi:hypothetical protein D3C78_1734110 [compost metagenome]
MPTADKAFGQLVDQVLRLQRHLPGHIKRQGVRPMFVKNRAQPLGSLVNGQIHACLHRVTLALITQISPFHAP